MAENEKKKNENEQLKMAVVAIKEAYDKAFKDNPSIMRDLRTFCNLDLPTNMNAGAGDLDTNKVFIKTGRASVFARIEYWVNTPVEQILIDEKRKWEQR